MSSLILTSKLAAPPGGDFYYFQRTFINLVKDSVLSYIYGQCTDS